MMRTILKMMSSISSVLWTFIASPIPDTVIALSGVLLLPATCTVPAEQMKKRRTANMTQYQITFPLNLYLTYILITTKFDDHVNILLPPEGGPIKYKYSS